MKIIALTIMTHVNEVISITIIYLKLTLKSKNYQQNLIPSEEEHIQEAEEEENPHPISYPSYP